MAVDYFQAFVRIAFSSVGAGKRFTTLWFYFPVHFFLELAARTVIDVFQFYGLCMHVLLLHHRRTLQGYGEIADVSHLHNPSVGKQISQFILKRLHGACKQAAAQTCEFVNTVQKFILTDGSPDNYTGVKWLLFACLLYVGRFIKVVL